jgi:hypothetical protein
VGCPGRSVDALLLLLLTAGVPKRCTFFSYPDVSASRYWQSFPPFNYIAEKPLMHTLTMQAIVNCAYLSKLRISAQNLTPLQQHLPEVCASRFLSLRG